MTDYSGYRMNERGCTAERLPIGSSIDHVFVFVFVFVFFFRGGGGGAVVRGGDIIL